jgi:hypothetical protein
LLPKQEAAMAQALIPVGGSLAFAFSRIVRNKIGDHNFAGSGILLFGKKKKPWVRGAANFLFIFERPQSYE